MGLDNGIIVRLNNSVDRSQIPSFVRCFFDEFRTGNEFEVCYWRKCWNMRNDILNVIKTTGNNEYQFNLDADDISDIKNVVARYFDIDYFDSHDDTIWDYKELLSQNIRCYINLCWLESFMQENPNIEVYFYDSY